jgi:hypothetical protein
MKNGQARSVFFRDISQRRVLIPYTRYGQPTDPIFKGQEIPLKMGPIICAETSVENYHSTLRNIPEECVSHLYHGGNMISCND